MILSIRHIMRIKRWQVVIMEQYYLVIVRKMFCDVVISKLLPFEEAICLAEKYNKNRKFIFSPKAKVVKFEDIFALLFKKINKYF
jgi:hypothetical protein